MRIAHLSSGESPSSSSAMETGGELYQYLIDRCRSLEASHAELADQLDDLRSENRRRRRNGEPLLLTSDSRQDLPVELSIGQFPGRFASGSPYKSVLDSLGHALLVCRASSGKIVYWNRSCEKLYGWRDYEVLHQRCFTELLVPEDHYVPLQKIIGRLMRTGEPWSGRFPFKRKSGKTFLALVTKSLLYENGELAGIIVVASDASVVGIQFENQRSNQESESSQQRERGLSFRKIKWHSRPPIAPAPESGSSFSSLASKMLSKLQIKGTGSHNSEDDGMNRQTSESKRERTPKSNGSPTYTRGNLGVFSTEFPNLYGDDENYECFISSKNGSQSPTLGVHGDCMETEDEDNVLRNVSHVNSSGKGDKRSNSGVEWDILWEDLQMGEEIGQGFYAIVYRGIWNGSEVAIKVYLNEYDEGSIQDYKKEIDIMKRLRHPNVLLFMGAACSQERLAIITEFLPRGSLFKTLHKSNQDMDFKRRMRMALDVARGMNYLHRRNPPIVHRDLKSSNILVDKNWTVKVGDFGLSRLKTATFLTARSGRGTPQWMAPEVLRNDPSNEKSDVYSFGVILWELLTKSIPWNNLNPLQVVGVVGFMDRRLEIPEGSDPQVASLIRDCWKSDPAERPSFEEIIRRMLILNPRLATPTTQRSVEV